MFDDFQRDTLLRAILLAILAFMLEPISGDSGPRHNTTNSTTHKHQTDHPTEGRTKNYAGSQFICQYRTSLMKQYPEYNKDSCEALLHPDCVAPMSCHNQSNNTDTCQNHCPAYDMERKKCGPAFFIIGAQKAATTSLFSFLETHPQLCPSKRKELQFYGKYAPNDQQLRLTRYLNRFSERENCSAGDATPRYCISADAAHQIKQDWPNARLIFLVRDPTNRAKSHYDMILGQNTTGKKKKPLQDFHNEIMMNIHKGYRKGHFFRNESRLDLNALGKSNDLHFVERGMYASMIEFWATLFPPQQILIARFEDLISKTHQPCMLRNILRFIGLQADNIGPDFRYELPHENAPTRSANVSLDDLQYLRDFFRPYNLHLNRILGWDLGYNRDTNETRHTKTKRA